MGLTARGPEISGGFATETISADPDVVAEHFYDWIQERYQGTALGSLEGLAAEMNYSYALASTIGESVMTYALQAESSRTKNQSFEQSVIELIAHRCGMHISGEDVASCLNSIGRHILVQLSVYRHRPQQYFYR